MAKTNAERQQEYRERGREMTAKALAGLMAEVGIERSDTGEVFTITLGPKAIADLELAALAQDSTVTAILRTAIEKPMTIAVYARSNANFRYVVN